MSEPTDHAAGLRAIAASTYFAPTLVGAQLDAAADELDRLKARVAELERRVAPAGPATATAPDAESPLARVHIRDWAPPDCVGTVAHDGRVVWMYLGGPPRR